ncbi:unnamed protein product, partial [marine sediment metagenome]
IYVTLGVSLNLIYGFTGQFSLGHAGFMAIGAYVTTLLVLPPYYKEMIFILEPLVWPFTVMQAPFIVALLLSGLLSALVAILVGLPVLRLRGDYLGIATLGFAEIVRIIANNIPQITNGALGIKGIPEFSWTVKLGNIFLPSGISAIPFLTILSVGILVISLSLNFILPFCGLINPQILLKVVLLPAPFAPIKVITFPMGTSNEIPFKACIPPKKTFKLLILSIVCIHPQISLNYFRIILNFYRISLSNSHSIIHY